jgi:predicted branched-subunit amino acid permease
MSVTRDSRAAARIGFLTTGISVFALWNLFTFVGAIAGNLIGDPRQYGLDAAVGAAFLALLWPRLSDPRNRVVAVCAAAVALGVVPLTAPGVPVLVAGGVALLAGVLTRSSVDDTEIPEVRR